MTITILGSQIFNQAIEETATIQAAPLGSIVNGVDENTYVQRQYIYASGAVSTAVNSIVSIDPVAFTTTLSGVGGISATAMSANVAGQFGWYLINQSLPVSGSFDLTAATLTLTAAYSGKTILLDKANGITVTLPAATGSGNKFRFVVIAAVTSVGDIIKVANSSDIMTGNALSIESSGGVIGFKTGATDDTITLNGTTTGGLKGDVVEIEDIATNLFAVFVSTQSSGTEVTPFSSGV